jgi:diacylglycerol O-acyltransferase
MSRLSLLDLLFFVIETEASPKHVAGLMIFEKPEGSKPSWVKQLAAQLQSHDQPTPPFNQVINFRALGGPAWSTADHFDIEDHVIYHKPNHILSEEQLFAFASKLHEPLMDRDKPLWEFHLIDRIEGDRFALYAKIHHAYADGMTMSSWLLSSLSSSPTVTKLTAFWEHEKSSSKQQKAASKALFKRLIGRGRQARQVTFGIGKLVAQLALEQTGLTRNAVSLPFKAREDSLLTGPVTAQRQLATASIGMDSIGELRRATRCTLNHIALTCIDGALRRYLGDQGVVLDRPISIQMPVNLRDKNAAKGGNEVGIVLVDLAPDVSDPYTRLREIGFTLRSVRNQIDGVPAIAVSQYTIAMVGLMELVELLNLTTILPAVSDTLVSNVPGPRDVLYLKGARMEQMIPISTLAPGTQLNITLYSYGGKLFIGLVATDQVIELANLGHYIEAAFDELEEAVYGSME